MADHTLDVEAESVELAPDGARRMIVIPQLAVAAGSVPWHDLCAGVAIASLNVERQTVHSTYDHEVPTATTATCKKTIIRSQTHGHDCHGSPVHLLKPFTPVMYFRFCG